MRSAKCSALAVMVLAFAVTQTAWSAPRRLVGERHSSTLDTQPFTSTDNAITVYQNAPEFSIKLKSNPSTGYHWFLTRYPHQLIVPRSHRYYPSKSKRVGAPGYEIWVFKVLPDAFRVPQMMSVSLIYARPFQLKHAAAKTFSIISAARSSSLPL